jgi:hypothetical protein
VNATALIIEGGPVQNGAGIESNSTFGIINATATYVRGNGLNNFAIRHTVGAGQVNVIAPNIEGGPQGGSTGIQLQGTSTVATITGNAKGGGGGGALGINSSSGGSVAIIFTGIATAVGLNHAIGSASTANGVTFEGDMIDSPQGAVAVYTRIFRMTATNSGVTQYANTVGYPTGTLVSRVSPDNVTGMAQIADVRLNTIYGYNNELTGTVAIPAAQSVAYGVPVDATTGTAEFDLARVAQIIGLQVAAGATEGTSL